MWLKYIHFLLWLLILSQSVFVGQVVAQTNHTLHGTIEDVHDQPIPFAYVVIDSLKIGTVSDDKGKYQLTSIPTGLHKIIVSSLGYQSKTIEKQFLKNAQEVLIDVVLSSDDQILDAVTIVGESESSKLRSSARAVSVIETKEARTQTADLGEVLTQVSGVNVRRSGGLGSGERFSLNGLTDDQIRFMIDGIPMDLMGYVNGISNVPVNHINRAEIYKGVVPIDLGTDALGGAVNLVSMKDSMINKGGASYKLGSFGTHQLSLNGQSKQSSNGWYARGSSFYDYSKNNYEVDVEIPGAGGKLSSATVPRFHDGYQAYGLRGTLGIRDKKWTEDMSLELFANRYNQEVQNNNIMSIVYGGITTREENIGGLLRYQKNLDTGIELNATVGYTFNQVNFVDTSVYIFTWRGDVVRDQMGTPRVRSPGELGTATDQLTWNKGTYGRFIVKVPIDDYQFLRFASAPTYTHRSGDERWDEENETLDPLNNINTILSWVNGTEYIYQPMGNKIENNFFLKHYFQNVDAIEYTNGLPINLTRESHHFGIGNSLRYRFNAQWLMKASYEWATRLPRPTEIFGNGRLILPNLSLKPERSHNVNFEINFSNHRRSKYEWKIVLNSFLRNTDQLILISGTDEVFTYNNVFAARSIGIELSSFWNSINRRLFLEANTTIQDFTNLSTQGIFGQFSGSRIPNRPYFFANGKIRYQIPTIFSSTDRLALFLSTRYVNQFYRGWENFGLKKFKDFIPSQFVQNLGGTYTFSIGSNLLACTLEMSNITDSKVYDFFGVQRPGRAIYFKIFTQF